MEKEKAKSELIVSKSGKRILFIPDHRIRIDLRDYTHLQFLYEKEDGKDGFLALPPHALIEAINKYMDEEMIKHLVKIPIPSMPQEDHQ